MNSSFKKIILMNTLYGLLWGVIFIWAKYMDVISEAPKGGVFRFDFQSLVGCILLSGIYLFPLFKMAVKNTNLLEWKKSIALNLSTILALFVGTFDISKKEFLITREGILYILAIVLFHQLLFLIYKFFKRKNWLKTF
ncbi:hypothetical protein [Granulicatella adiacens]|uniref:hypothetical protein n=1 Tax=Granulicatella adiacens TaxID=46124 RepID=UPI001C3CDB86|nr:hypothetical protein [Granulicatella adiacens]